MKIPNTKWNAATFREIQREFLRFGYNPYESLHPVEWAHAMNAVQAGKLNDVTVPQVRR